MYTELAISTCQYFYSEGGSKETLYRDTLSYAVSSPSLTGSNLPPWDTDKAVLWGWTDNEPSPNHVDENEMAAASDMLLM